MSRLIAIDPGTTACGWAEFTHGFLARCGLVRTQARELPLRASGLSLQLARLIPFEPDTTLAIERPEVYRQRFLKGDPNDLIAVAIVVGSILSTFPPAKVLLPLPKEWKSNVPKDVTERRLRKNLSSEELGRLIEHLEPVPPSLRHNVFDAVALGRWALSNGVGQ